MFYRHTLVINTSCSMISSVIKTHTLLYYKNTLVIFLHTNMKMTWKKSKVFTLKLYFIYSIFSLTKHTISILESCLTRQMTCTKFEHNMRKIDTISSICIYCQYESYPIVILTFTRRYILHVFHTYI